MSHSFPAILENGVIMWGANSAPPPNANGPVAVEVVVPTPRPATPYDHMTLRERFEELARLDPFRDIDDPVEYIRELRRDPPLGGREE